MAMRVFAGLTGSGTRECSLMSIDVFSSSSFGLVCLRDYKGSVCVRVEWGKEGSYLGFIMN